MWGRGVHPLMVMFKKRRTKSRYYSGREGGRGYMGVTGDGEPVKSLNVCIAVGPT